MVGLRSKKLSARKAAPARKALPKHVEDMPLHEAARSRTASAPKGRMPSAHAPKKKSGAKPASRAG